MSKIPQRLSGEVVLVTGGSQGIGRAVALRCAAEGADVVLAARSVENLSRVSLEVEAIGRRAVIVPADLREPAAFEAAILRAADVLGPISLAVANSGVPGPTAPIWAVSLEEWNDTIGVNLTGAFVTCRAVLPGMMDRGRGSIVLVGSMAGKRTLKARSPYVASKAGLNGLVRTIASDVGESGVRINLVSPGVVEGERLEAVLDADSHSRGISLEQARSERSRLSLLGRNADPEDVAAAVAFLLSDDARSITGEDLNVSCGAMTH